MRALETRRATRSLGARTAAVRAVGPAMISEVCGALVKLAVVATLAALALARAVPVDPRAEASDGRGRTAAAAPMIVGPDVAYHFPRRLAADSGRMLFFDVDQGRSVRKGAMEVVNLYLASGAPWRDDRGRSELVGFSNNPAASAGRGPALVRVSLPDGAILGRLPVECAPLGRPCWFDDRSARILVVDAGGRLATIDLESNPDERAPWTLAWREDTAGSDGLLMGDLAWPTDPRLRGRILVMLSERSICHGKGVYGPAQIWWLELDGDRTEIVAAGRLFRSTAGDLNETTIRFPTIESDADGRLVLAYLERPTHPAKAGCRLRVVPVQIDPQTGAPFAEGERIRTLADDSALVPPAFSSDGRWLNYHSGPAGAGSPWQVRRASLTEAAAG